MGQLNERFLNWSTYVAVFREVGSLFNNFASTKEGERNVTSTLPGEALNKPNDSYGYHDLGSCVKHWKYPFYYSMANCSQIDDTIAYINNHKITSDSILPTVV